jgi:hypothetical protein
MAISDLQKVDLLFKKVGYGISKTDIATYKSPSNEGNASPLISPGSTIYQQDYAIAGATILPTSNSSVVTVYRDSLNSTIQCTKLPTTSVNVSWTTGLTDWIPVQYGTGYQVKLYAGPSGSSTPQNFVNLPAGGSGNNDDWTFDYQAGIVNFADTNVPTAVAGNVVYVVGARYTGIKGITTWANITANAISVTSNITSNGFVGNIYADAISSNAASYTKFTGTTGVVLPVGNNSNRPAGTAGQIRFNTDISVIEFYNGSSWIPVTNSINDQQISPDGVTQSFTLSQSSTAAGLIVSINGTIQNPGIAYTVVGDQIAFAEIPQASDYIDIRFIASAVTSNADYEIIDTANVQVGTSNVIIDTFGADQYRSAKYTISSTNPYDSQLSEVSIIQQGSKLGVSTVVVATTGANAVTFGANINGSSVNLLAKGSIASNQLRIKRTYFNI